MLLACLESGSGVQRGRKRTVGVRGGSSALQTEIGSGMGQGEVRIWGSGIWDRVLLTWVSVMGQRCGYGGLGWGRKRCG